MDNPYLAAFIEEISARYGLFGADDTVSQWITNHTKLNQMPFSYEGHEFQQQIIDDPARHLVVKKCSQVGLTEVIVRYTLAFLARNQGTTSIMTQPTRSAALAFSTTRVQEILDESPILNNLLNKNIDAKELKAIGRSYLYIKGTIGAATAISVPADMIITDEYDFSDLEVVGKYNSRLSHSPHKIIRRFSTPTIPKFAISKEFDQSTQNIRLQKCPHCGHWNEHDFFRDVAITNHRFKDYDLHNLSMDDLVEVDPSDINMLCEKCRRPVAYHEYTKQEWVPKYPKRFIAGYHVRPWNTATQTPFDLLRSREDYELYDDWVNFALGLDYIDAKYIFDTSKIEVTKVPLHAPIFVGIDFGKTCYVVTGYPLSQTEVVVNRAVEVHEDKLLKFVKELIYSEFVVGMVLDALPQTKLASDIQKLLPNKARTAYYSDSQKDLYALKGNDKDVTLARTKVFDRVLGLEKVNLTPDANEEQFSSHMQGMAKQRLKDEIESERYVKIKPDHFLHAFGYMYMASVIYSEGTSHVAVPSVSTTKMA